MEKKIKKIKNLFFMILMILYTILNCYLMIFMRMLFKPQMIIFIFFLPFFEIGAFEKKGRFSVGGGIHNFMENGILRCEGRGGCDTTTGRFPAPVNYKQSSTVYSVEYFFSKPISCVNAFDIVTINDIPQVVQYILCCCCDCCKAVELKIID